MLSKTSREWHHLIRQKLQLFASAQTCRLLTGSRSDLRIHAHEGRPSHTCHFHPLPGSGNARASSLPLDRRSPHPRHPALFFPEDLTRGQWRQGKLTEAPHRQALRSAGTGAIPPPSLRPAALEGHRGSRPHQATKNWRRGSSLAGHWPRLRAPNVGGLVRSMVRELDATRHS